MIAEQLEFDFGVMETIDRSLNMPKRIYTNQCKSCNSDMKYDEISQKDNRYCVDCVGS